MRFSIWAGCTVLVLAGCSGEPKVRHIVKLDEEMLIVVEREQHIGAKHEAKVHYLMGIPMSFAEDSLESVMRMDSEVAIDCTAGHSAERTKSVRFLTGRSLNTVEPKLIWEAPTPGTVGASVVKAVCDPAFAEKTGVKLSMAAIERRYAKKYQRKRG